MAGNLDAPDAPVEEVENAKCKRERTNREVRQKSVRDNNIKRGREKQPQAGYLQETNLKSASVS